MTETLTALVDHLKMHPATESDLRQLREELIALDGREDTLETELHQTRRTLVYLRQLISANAEPLPDLGDVIPAIPIPAMPVKRKRTSISQEPEVMPHILRTLDALGSLTAEALAEHVGKARPTVLRYLKRHPSWFNSDRRAYYTLWSLTAVGRKQLVKVA